MPPAPEKPVVCYVTDRSAFREQPDSTRALLERIRMAASVGVDWIQIREKDLQGGALLKLVSAAIDAVRNVSNSTTKIIVNDRLDIAIAAGADGVHLGGASIPVGDVVRWCRAGSAPKSFLVGASCHSIVEAPLAADAGANYIIFGPVFDTPSKRAFGTPQGVAALTEICRGTPIPVIAIGGINSGNAVECLLAGAAGVAAIREFQQATDAETERRFVERVHQGK